MHTLAGPGKLILTVSIGWSVCSYAMAAQEPTDLKSEAKSEATPLPPASAKVTRHAERLLANYDADQSGHLSKEQWSQMRGRPGLIDRNQDSKVTLDELLLHIIEYGRYRRLGTATTSQTLPRDVDPSGGQSAPETGDSSKPGAPFHVPTQALPAGLPRWFRLQDGNGDGQLSLAEYAPTSSQEAVVAFERLDSNRDGLLTPQECVQPVKAKADPGVTDGGNKGAPVD